MSENKNTIILSRRSVEQIISEEITSAAYYNKRYCHPSWPGGDSGVTIGIGYDLGYNTREQIIADWRNKLNEEDLQALLHCSGKKGPEAKALCATDRMKQIYVGYTEAYKVFVFKTLPRFCRAAKQIYPGIELLLPDAAGALVGMVFNRGNSLVGDRRKEMKAIVPLVVAKDYNGIAEQITASKRLWEGKGMDGLLSRRDREANLVKGAVRQYSREELIEIPL